MRDLAAQIHRQRLVIDGTPAAVITECLSKLSVELDMVEILAPVMRQSELSGLVHWEPGARFYAWDEPLLVSVNIYTCKAFSAEVAVRFTDKFFAATGIVFKQF